MKMKKPENVDQKLWESAMMDLARLAARKREEQLDLALSKHRMKIQADKYLQGKTK